MHVGIVRVQQFVNVGPGCLNQMSKSPHYVYVLLIPKILTLWLDSLNKKNVPEPHLKKN